MNRSRGPEPAAQRFASQLHRNVHEILWVDWDPIGVRGQGWPDDEYDNYVSPVVDMLRCRESPQLIADYLGWVTTEYMRLTPDLAEMRQKHLTLARRLLELEI